MYFSETYSEFERLVDEFKDALKNEVKGEHKARMELLEKENEDLKNVKDRLVEIEKEYSQKMLELNQKIKEAKSMRIKELLADTRKIYYLVVNNEIEQKKCDKCDEHRRIFYVTPLGRDTYEYCKCSEMIDNYIPIEREVINVSINNKKDKVTLEIKDYDNDYGWSNFIVVQPTNIYSGQDYREVKYNTLFTDKVEALKYCDWKNSYNKALEI